MVNGSFHGDLLSYHKTTIVSLTHRINTNKHQIYVHFCLFTFAFPQDWLCLALNWVCFFADPKREILHNHLSAKTLRQFRPTANWVCFFNLSSIFRRFLLFSTCFFHYSAFFSTRIRSASLRTSLHRLAP